MSSKLKDSYSVLLADDSDKDRLLIRHALLKHPRLVIVGEVTDGVQVIDYLRATGEFKNRKKHPFPDLLILDLKMPLKSGYEVLEWLRVQSFADLVVAVVSGSVLPEDLKLSLELGADAFFVKAAERRAREAMVSKLEVLLDLSRRK